MGPELSPQEGRSPMRCSPSSAAAHTPREAWAADSFIEALGLCRADLDASEGLDGESVGAPATTTPTTGNAYVGEGRSAAAAPGATTPTRGPTPVYATAPDQVREVITRWASGTALAKARRLSDAELVRELAEVRRALAELSGPRRDTNSEASRALRSAQTELEFEARRRSDRVQGERRSLDPLAEVGELSEQDELAGRSAESITARVVALRKLDSTVAREGIRGAERRLRSLEAEPEGEVAGQDQGSHATREPMSWLRSELALRREEAQGFLERFEQVGRSIARALLAESASRLQAELARYGLRSGPALPDGSLHGMGLARGHSDAAVADAVAQGRAIRVAYEAARAAPVAARAAAWERFEQVKQLAVVRHPLLAGFLAGRTELARARPTSLVPNALELGETPPALMGAMLGWELNRKLLDNRATLEHLESGRLSIFGAPKVVELTKLEMRVADGMMLDGAVDERVAYPPGQPWTHGALQAITLALGLLLLAPTGGVSAGVATAGNVALLASDLYLLGKDAEDRAAPRGAANTDLTLEESLLDEEPAAAPLLHQLLGGLGFVAGVHGVAQGAAHLQAVALARQGVAEMRALRRTLAEHGADAMHAQVRTAADQFRATARRARLSEDQIEAMLRTALRGSTSARTSAWSMGLDHAAKVTDESAQILAQRMGVPKVVRTGEPGARVGVRLSRQGAPQIEQLEVAADATVGDVLLHQVTVEAMARYGGLWGKVKQTQDRLVATLRRSPRAGGAGPNLHPVRSRAHELFEEVRKHEAAVQVRVAELVHSFGSHAEGAQRAAWALEDQIKVLEGELAYYRQALADVEATGNVEAARGVIEAIGDASRAAVAKGYEAPPQGYYYHRNAWKPEEYVISRNAGRDDLPQLQVHRTGSRWGLGPAEEARPPRVFSASLDDTEVLHSMLQGSSSWRTFRDALVHPDKIGLPAAAVRRRSLRAIEPLRKAERGGGRVEITEDLIRRALKDEFRDDILRATLAKPTREEQVVFLRKVTEDFGLPNGSDKGSLFEALLAAQDRSLTRHALLEQAALAKRRPPIHISRDRVVDLLANDGTLIEVKAVKTAMGKEQMQQLQDYLAVTNRGGEAAGRSGGVRAKRIVYAFIEPDGVAANRTFIDRALNDGATIRVYNRAGASRDFARRESGTIEAAMEFAQGAKR